MIGVVKLDPGLDPFSEALKRRYGKSQDWINRIKATEGGLEKFSRVSYIGFVLIHLPSCRSAENLIMHYIGLREVWPKCE